MILQVLTRHYETLAAEGKIAAPGWSAQRVTYALYLNEDGSLRRVVDIRTEQKKGKKTELLAQSISVPAPVKRSSGILANFLCDNSGYLLGVDNKGKQERTLACFAASRELHERVLKTADSPSAQALLRFFEQWKPENAADHPALRDCYDELLAGVNLIFRDRSGYLHEDPAIRTAWERHYSSRDADSKQMVCLVTGEYGAVAATHPAIKNVQGAQSSGAALVAFNAPAYCSYGKEQNYNAPVSNYAAFAYTAALNYLLADQTHRYRLGDATVVCWAKNGDSAYQDVFGCVAMGLEDPTYSEADMEAMLSDLLQGRSVLYQESKLDPNMEFYVLGISPNAARLSVRFFLRNTFGQFLQNVQKHHERLDIVRPNYDTRRTLSLGQLLDETVNHNSRDQSPSPNLAGETLRAILNNNPYPALLLNGVVLRIRAERRVTRGRAAILKAYYLKKPHKDICEEEVLTVSLKENSTSIPYNLGRLFSVLEDIQQKANPTINATITDKYFSAASSTPGVVFPTLIGLAQKHLRKMDEKVRLYYRKQLQELMGKLEEAFPAQLSLPQQGAFQLGYYHQTQDRYLKKEDKANG